jgi:hypothetical protein
MPPKYYFYYLEIALKDPKDSNIYGFENLSHIPASKLIDIFGIDLKVDPNISEGYFLTEAMFEKHKDFISKNFGVINLNVFEYCLRLYGSDDPTAIRKLYKESILE